MIFQVFLVTSIFLQCASAQDFLWKDNNGKLIDNGKKQIIPKRWARSLYTWVHSPLINSVEKVIEIDEDKSPYSTTAQTIKRFQRENTEKFEEEFFLWQDGEGKPLRFGLKQIDDNQNVLGEQKVNKVDYPQQRQISAPLWQNPLFYEDNDDVEDDSIGSQLLSLHEDGLSHILKTKFESMLSFFYPKKSVDKNSFTTQNIKKSILNGEKSNTSQKGISPSLNGMKKYSKNSAKSVNASLTLAFDQVDKKYQENHLESPQNNTNNYINSKILDSNQQHFLKNVENKNILTGHFVKSNGNVTHDSSKIKLAINHSDEPHFPSSQYKNNNVHIEEVHDNYSLQKVLIQPKFNELSFIENSQNIDDSDNTYNEKLTTNYNELKRNVLNKRNHKNLKGIRRHKIVHPGFDNSPPHQFELYGTTK